ncbi:P60-like protein [Kalmanozyma brasiliensis GHG001]|uniref:Ribosome biogenesis protein NOP53 n=1 Tax=Kalmanozyma brasiliensis (strain GHG001) TaxID=1365824 RepID=V5EV81_KALBG|nr:P60-like protein [Kalmanozyma brasiliensis GHG001]EST07123.1 P60-like protein [Kalmanozyma brasiliensis GHG001]
MAPTRTKSTTGQPAQPAQSSRKGKKAWRKNIDLTTTETFLDAQSDPLRSTASDVLFVEDRSGQETLLAKQARTKKPLKSLEILSNSYGHSALNPVRKSKSVDRKTQERLRKMVGRQKHTTQGDASSIAAGSDEVVKKSLGGVYDVWGGEGKGKAKADWIPETSAKPTPSLPKTLRRADHDTAASLPAIDLPHPGSSYNPTLESHEALIQQAYEIERRLEESEQMAQSERESWQRKLATIIAREAELREQKDDELKRYRGMDVDLPNASEEEVSEGEREELDSSDEKAGIEGKRKTRAQRVRAKRARQQQAEAARRKQARIEAAAILQLPAEKRRQARLALARSQAASARRLEKEALLAKQGLSGVKVGKHKVPQQTIDVQTGDQLSESLRALQPEGNLFRDRYNRMQARGVVEPRVKQVAKTSTRRIKGYETHDYKKFT